MHPVRWTHVLDALPTLAPLSDSTLPCWSTKSALAIETLLAEGTKQSTSGAMIGISTGMRPICAYAWLELQAKASDLHERYTRLISR